jgi:hypothetical protein
VVSVLSGIPPASLSSFARTAVTFRRPPAAVTFLCSAVRGATGNEQVDLSLLNRFK